MATFGDKRVWSLNALIGSLPTTIGLLRVPQEIAAKPFPYPGPTNMKARADPGYRRYCDCRGKRRCRCRSAEFLKSIIVFWLLGATDGHAKNFSIFLSPGGGYRLTPLYDIVSAQPSLDAKQIGRNKTEKWQ